MSMSGSPDRFYCFRAAAKFFNSLLCGNSGLLKKIVHALLSYKKRWAAEFKEACEGLYASDRYTDCVKAAIPLPPQDFDTHSQTGYLSCMDSLASHAKLYAGPSPFAACIASAGTE